MMNNILGDCKGKQESCEGKMVSIRLTVTMLKKFSPSNYSIIIYDETESILYNGLNKDIPEELCDREVLYHESLSHCQEEIIVKNKG